jgi:hypothetical protein
MYDVVTLINSSDRWCRDNVQDFLAAKALDEGRNPYQPISRLMNDYGEYAPHCTVSDNPTPHTPQAITLMSLFPRKTLLELSWWWLGVQLSSLVTVCWLLWRYYLDSKKHSTFFLMLGFLCASFAGFSDLAYGNFSSVLLLLFTLIFVVEADYLPVPRYLSKSCVIGAILGLSLALKTSGWVFLAYFLLTYRWKVVAWCLTTVALTVVGVVLYHDRSDLFATFIEAGWHVRAYYSRTFFNQSIWSLGTRMFEGLKVTSIGAGVRAPPLIALPFAARPADFFIGLSVVGIFMMRALRSPSRDHALAILALVASIADPLSWEHYLLFSFLALAVIGKGIARQSGGMPSLLYFGVCLMWCAASPNLWDTSHGQTRTGLTAWLTGMCNLPVVVAAVILLERLNKDPEKIPTAL